MTPDQQRIAIATACGWTDIRRQRLYAGDQDLWGTKLKGGEKHRNRLPNYLGDLNACHEMEKVLNYEQAELFEDSLCDIAKSANDVLKNPLQSKSFIFHATAPQRAEAFRRTLGLWQSTPTQPQ
jgi:hypothetical protein